MKKITIEKENGHLIPCIAEISANCNKIVIMIHGMNSSKESQNVSFMMEYLTKRGLGVVAYDQPGHGTEEAASEALLLRNCLDSLSEVEKHVHGEYPDAEICYFGSSFGGYVLGTYLARGLNSGHKAFMRCSAVIFPQLIIGDVHAEPDPEVMKILDSIGFMETVVDGKPIRFLKAFLEELRDNSLIDIYNERLPEKVEMSFVHGEKDPVVPMHAVKAFAEKHGYPIVVIPDEGHSISNSPDSPVKVAEIACKFFG